MDQSLNPQKFVDQKVMVHTRNRTTIKQNLCKKWDDS